jgi:hypothetical protein
MLILQIQILTSFIMPSNNPTTFEYINLILPSVMGVITFILGYVVSNSISNKKDKTNLIAIYEYFTLYLNHQLESIDVQIELMKEQIIKLGELDSMEGLSITLKIQPYYALDSINKEALMQSFKHKGKKPDESLIIINYIELTRHSFEHYKIYHQDYIESQQELRARWNDALKEFINFKRKAFNKTIGEINGSQDLIAMNRIFNEWSEIKNGGLKHSINNLVEPIDKYFGPIYSISPNNEYAGECLRISARIDMVFKEWQDEQNTYRRFLETSIQSIETFKSDNNSLILP